MIPPYPPRPAAGGGFGVDYNDAVVKMTRAATTTILGWLLLLESVGQMVTSLMGLPWWYRMFITPEAPHPYYLRVRIVALGWGLFPFLKAMAGLGAAWLALRRSVALPHLLSLSLGIMAGSGVDWLYWSAGHDLKQMLGMAWKSDIPFRLEGLLGLLRGAFLLMACPILFHRVPWQGRRGGTLEGSAPRGPVHLLCLFTLGVLLTFAVAEGTRRVSDSMGKW